MFTGCIAWTLNNSKLLIIWAIIVKFQNVWKTSKLYNIYPKADFWETWSFIGYIYLFSYLFIYLFIY